MITYEWHKTKQDTVVITRDKRLTQEQKMIIRQVVGAAQSCVHRDMRRHFLRRHIRLAIELIRND